MSAQSAVAYTILGILLYVPITKFVIPMSKELWKYYRSEKRDKYYKQFGRSK